MVALNPMRFIAESISTDHNPGNLLLGIARWFAYSGHCSNKLPPKPMCGAYNYYDESD